MALGKVNVSAQDTGSGEFSTPERQLVYVGYAGKNAGLRLYIDQSSDLDDLLGINNSNMKTAITAARLNAGANWTCVALPRSAIGQWEDGIDDAMANNVVCEGAVLTDAVMDQATIVAMYVKQVAIENEYSRALFFMAPTEAMLITQTWAEFIAAHDLIQDGTAAETIMLVPEVYAGWCGALAGRLCNENVSIADSPMRTATGTIVGLAALPKDKDGVTYNMSHAKALNDARGSVPQIYADYDGFYVSDGMTLATQASDFQVIENLRAINKVKRKTRILMVKKVADRSLNSTAASIAAHENYFMRPMVDMSKGFAVTPDLKPPQEGDVTITWPTRTSVEVLIMAQPFNSPKSISAYIRLNLTSEA